MINHVVIRYFILGLLLLNLSTTFAESRDRKERKPLPSYTDLLLANTVADFIELGESPTVDGVVLRAKEKLKNLDDYAERVALKPRDKTKPYLTGGQLVKLKERNLRMNAELDQMRAKARRNNRTTGIKRAFRFVTSALHVPIKIAGKVRSGLERLIPNEIKPIFRVLAGKYMLNKYNTFLKAFVAKHSTPKLIRALDIWKTALVVKENPQIVSKILQGRIDELGRNEIGKLISDVTQKGLAKLPDNAIGQVLGNILVMKASELNKRFGDILTREGGIIYNRAFKEKITKMAARVVALTPGENVQKQFEKAGVELQEYILKRGVGLGQEEDKDQKPESEKIIAAFEASPMSGMEPLTVTFDASDSEGPIVKYSWWFGDQEKEVEGKKATHTFDAS